MADDERSCCSEHDDQGPPFALPESGMLPESLLMKPQHLDISSYPNVEYAKPESQESVGSILSQTRTTSSSSQPPGLASSMVSCSSSESTTEAAPSIPNNSSSHYLDASTASFLPGESISSHYLDAMASLLVPMQMGEDSSQLVQQSRAHQVHESTHTATGPLYHHAFGYQSESPTAASDSISLSSMGYSQLMNNADNAKPASARILSRQRLPVLPEEEGETIISQPEEESFRSTNSSLTPSQMRDGSQQYSSNHIAYNWLPVDILGRVSAACSPSSDQTSTFATRDRSRSLELNSIRNTGVFVRQLDTASFEVSIDLIPHCTVPDIMEVVGNPSLLRLWCESIRSLVITNSSEGARNATNRNGNAQEDDRQRAQYDGEWTELVSTELVAPPSASSCVYSTSKTLWNYIGFPTYGKISMFVERQKGRVGLTVGPFPGDLTVSHTISVDDTEPNMMKIVDRVTLARDVSGSELLCGLFECFESCFLPTIKGYIDQTVSSLTRLRVLVENGERLPSRQDMRGPAFEERSAHSYQDQRQFASNNSDPLSEPLLP